MAKTKIKKAKRPAKLQLNETHFDLGQRLVFMFEKAKFAEYVDMMQKPWRFVWMNFWGGVWRGIGMTVGAAIVLYFSVKGLRYIFDHVGGLPWLGLQIKEMAGWLLTVVEQAKGGAGK